MSPHKMILIKPSAQQWRLLFPLYAVLGPLKKIPVSVTVHDIMIFPRKQNYSWVVKTGKTSEAMFRLDNTSWPSL